MGTRNRNLAGVEDLALPDQLVENGGSVKGDIIEWPDTERIDEGSVNTGQGIHFELEENQRLSRSLLWGLQRKFYAQQGIDSWSHGLVPHYITSNPYMADAYAKIVFGFFRDCQAGFGYPEKADAVSPGPSDQTVYILELGCGCGRFAYHFLNRFRELHRRSVLRDIPFKYIMSDLTEQNIEFWRSHPSFQTFMKEGILDFAHFDPQRETEVKQILCGRILPARFARNPMVFITNYFFDSIPQDMFYIKDGQLYEVLVRVSSACPEPDLTDPQILSRMNLLSEPVPAHADYYSDPDWNRILQDYTRNLTDTMLLFPTGPLECIRTFLHLSGGRMLILSADRGEYHYDELEGCKELKMAVHGSISLHVNFHAIGRYIVTQSGTVFHPAHRPSGITVSAYLMGTPSGGCIETRQAYEEAVNEFGPDDFFTLQKEIQEATGSLSLEQVLSFLKLSCWDAKILLSCFSDLMQQLDYAGEKMKQEIYSAVWKVWDLYYPIGEDTDVAFHLGVLLTEMRYYREALDFFQHSVRLYDYSAATAYSMAVCYYGLREMEEALKRIQQSLELDPSFEPAGSLCLKIESAIKIMTQRGTLVPKRLDNVV